MIPLKRQVVNRTRTPLAGALKGIAHDREGDRPLVVEKRRVRVFEVEPVPVTAEAGKG